MAEGSRGVPTCSGVAGRQDPVSGSGGCNFPEYELPELNTRAFHVGAFGELWRGRLRGAGDLSLREPPASALPGSRGIADSDREDAAVAGDLDCSLEAAAELRAVCPIQGPAPVKGQQWRRRGRGRGEVNCGRPGERGVEGLWGMMGVKERRGGFQGHCCGLYSPFLVLKKCK